MKEGLTVFREYKSILRPKLIYGCEAWNINKNSQLQLKIWEKRIMGRMFGRKRTDEKMYGLYERLIRD